MIALKTAMQFPGPGTKGFTQQWQKGKKEKETLVYQAKSNIFFVKIMVNLRQKICAKTMMSRLNELYRAQT